MNWSALLSAFIGAAAALLGVAVTQRGERAKAQLDRVWESRIECYKDLLNYSDGLKRYAFYRLAAEFEFVKDNAVPEPPKPIGGHDAALFASKPILSCFKKAQDDLVAIYAQHLYLTKFESSDPDETEKVRAEARARAIALADEVSKLGDLLERMIIMEVRSYTSPTKTTRRINWLAVPKVFFASLRKKPDSVKATPE